MTFEEFQASIQNPSKNTDRLSLELKSLSADAQGNWHQAHNLCQQLGTVSGDRIHAYLHRKEGDSGNAAYWYHRSGEKMPSVSLKEEWKELVERFL